MSSTYTVTSEPAAEPLTVAEIKESLRITGTDFDAELGRLLTAGRRQVEHDTHRKLITQTVANYRDEFPAGDTIDIRVAPVSSVTSIQYVDTDGATQTLAASNYHVDTTTTPPRIILKTDKTWPSTELNTPNAVTVTFSAGYGDAGSDVPAEARVAVTEWIMCQWDGDHGSHQTHYDRLIAKLRWTEYHAVE